MVDVVMFEDKTDESATWSAIGLPGEGVECDTLGTGDIGFGITVDAFTTETVD